VPGPDWRVTWVGHATVLIQADGLNLLTDPVWSPAAGPLGQLGPRRGTPPGVALADLPRIDVILLSHNHYDHMDIPTLRALYRRDRPTIVTPLGNGAYLEKRGISGSVELDWEGVWTHPSGARIRVTEARHFSSRGLFDRDRNLWGALIAELPSGTLYFAGDTGYGPHFAEAAERHGPFRLALLPIGAFLPRWMMRPVHVDPAEAVQAHLDLRAERSLAMGTRARACARSRRKPGSPPG
jgi:L-ascorbate metabolism protein UlaG (beta-lactamase superfamily)